MATKLPQAYSSWRDEFADTFALRRVGRKPRSYDDRMSNLFDGLRYSERNPERYVAGARTFFVGGGD